MSIKKWPVFVLLAVLVASALGTAPIRAQDTPTIAAAKCAAPGSLVMWVWDENWQKTLTKSADAWTAKYCPGAKVDVQVHPWEQYWDLVKTSAASGDLPDVFNMSQDRFQEFAVNNALLNLQPYLDKANIKPTVWGSGLVDPYRWGDKNDVYAAPLEWVTTALYYNKDLFDAAKLSYPTAQWTWDDFSKAAAALTDKAKDQYGAAVYAEYQGGYANWIASNGVTPVVDAKHTTCTLTDPASVEALNYLKDLQDKGYMPKVSVVGGSSADDAFNFFISSKVAMVSGGSWKLPDANTKIKFNWDVAQLPRSPKTGKSRAILHATSYVASAKSKNPDLAANLINFFISDEGQKFFADAGGVAPANPSATLQKEWIDSFGKGGKNIQAFVDATKESQGVTPFGAIWDTMNTELVVNIFDLGMSVNDATKKACDTIAKSLNK